MKPNYWICGGGSDINCDEWDDVSGCCKNNVDIFLCTIFQELNEEIQNNGGEEDH